MKDSVGSTVLIQIFVVFMVVFIILMASILNYTKTFRIKNQVVNIINRHGGYTSDAREEIKDYISKSSIYGQCVLLEGTNDFGSSTTDRCEIKEYKVKDAVGGSYYKVRVYVTFMFPLIKETLQIPITGETKRIYDRPNDAPETPTYEMVNKPYVPSEVSFSIEKDSCVPPKPPGSKGCCQKAVCAGSTLIGDGNGGCTCENGRRPGYNASLKGRKPVPGRTNACWWCYDCNYQPVSLTIDGASTIPAQKRTIKITVTDSSNVGYTCTPGGENSPITIKYDGADEEVKTGTIKCTTVGDEPRETTETFDVNVVNCSKSCFNSPSCYWRYEKVYCNPCTGIAVCVEK